jgi:quinol-cytochrome oxidoreductase complex cytochrome b subunit
MIFLLVYAWFVFYQPNFLGHPDNYIEANPLKTPAHIVPEWYYLPFYAMLRAITFNVGPIDSKLGGVLVMFGSIIILFFLPWLDTSKVRSAVYRPWYKMFFWLFVANSIMLGWLGAKPAEGWSMSCCRSSERSTTSRSSSSSCRCSGFSRRRGACPTRSPNRCLKKKVRPRRAAE